MNADANFNKELISYIADDKKNNGVIVPNNFNIYKSDANAVIAKIGNKSVIVTEKITQDFTIIGTHVWDILQNKYNALCYAIVGYIAQNIKYNTNIIKLTSERIRGYLKKEISDNTYYSAIHFLSSYNIISDCTLKGYFVINPTAVFKGSIYQYVDVCERYGLIESTKNNDGKVIIDKLAVINDKYGNDVDILLNKKYYPDSK